MHDTRQISCPMCGRSVTISGSGPIPCPSCGVPVSAPAAEVLVSPALADDDSATRVATIPPQLEPAPVEPAVAPAAPPVAETPAVEASTPTPIAAVSDTTDPRTQPVSEAEVRQAAYPPAAEQAPAATPAPEQPITQTYHGTPPQEPTTQAYQYSATQQPVTQPYTPAMAPTPQQQGQGAPKRNPALLIVGVVVAVVLLLGILGAAVVFANRAGPHADATATAAATATSAIPAGFVQFTDDGKVYSLDYPSAWTKTATAGDTLSLAVFSGSSAQVPAVFEVEYVKATMDPKALEDQFFKTLAAMGKVTNQQPPTDVSQAGATWQRETADIATGQTTQPVVSQHVVVLVTSHGQYTVLIAYLASKDAFDSADTQDFQPMLGSFQFL